jgi:hypothetical protein
VRLHLMHIDNELRGIDPEEEVYVITPGGGQTALAVPLDAIPDLLPLLAEALADEPEQCCEHCGGPLTLAQLFAD